MSGLLIIGHALLEAYRISTSVSIGFSIAIALFSKGISPYWRGQFVPLALVIPTVMACRLFREVRLGLIAEGETIPTLEEVAVSSATFANSYTVSSDELDELSIANDPHAMCEMELTDRCSLT